MTKRLVLILGALLVLAGSLAAACSSDTDDLETRIDAIEAQLAGNGDGNGDAQMQLQDANMVATLGLLDAVGFHELNETIDADGVAPAGTVGTIRKATVAVATTAWPADLEAEAGNLQTSLEAFLALLEDDAQGQELVDASLAAHDGYHSFTDNAWTYLGGHAGIESSGDDHEEMDMDHDEGTDAGTPMADDEMDHMDEEPTP